MQPNGTRKVIISWRWEHLIGWGVTFLLCLVPVILWLQIHPLSTIHGYVGIMLSIGRVAGLVGTVMYALNLVYSTRLRFLEYWFGGLNRVYIAHHMLGGLALIFLSIHPLFLALRYVTTSMKQAALMLVPNGLFPISALFDTKADIHPSVLQQWAVMFGSIAFWGMVGLLLITFFIRVPYRIWLFSHKFLGAAFFIASLHILFIRSDTTTEAGLKYYILGLAAIGIFAFVYRTLLSNIFIRKYNYVVNGVRTVAGNVTQIHMTPVDKTMPYKAGQFVFVRFRDGGDKVSREWHPFSISSAPGDATLELSVKGLGDYTNKLAELQEGAIADIEGAYGRFSYTNFTNKKQIWIAGGIGITPFLSMAKDLPKEGHNVDLYYAVKTESELIDWDKLYSSAVERPGGLRIIPFIGDKHEGHLDADVIERTSGDLQHRDFYICGPPPMMQSLRKQLRAKGVPGTSIHSEEFGMS